MAENLALLKESPLPLKAVIFDMDGVLIESEPLWEAAEITLLKSRGIEYDPLFREKVIGLNQIDSSKLIIREFGVKNCSPEEMIRQRIEILLGIYDKKLTMFEGSKALVEKIRESGFKTALASSSPMEVITYVLERFSLTKLFDAVVSGSCIQNGKPAPDIYLLAAEQLGVQPPECAAVEDSPIGVKSAVSAGMFCIGVPDKRLKAEEFEICDVICENIGQVEKIIA